MFQVSVCLCCIGLWILGNSLNFWFPVLRSMHSSLKWNCNQQEKGENDTLLGSMEAVSTIFHSLSDKDLSSNYNWDPWLHGSLLSWELPPKNTLWCPTTTSTAQIKLDAPSLYCYSILFTCILVCFPISLPFLCSEDLFTCSPAPKDWDPFKGKCTVLVTGVFPTPSPGSRTQ